MRPPLTIRQATQADLPTILKLDKEIFGAYGGEEDPEIISARLAVFPQGCAIFEAQQGEREEIIGYATTEKWSTLRDPSLNENPFETHDPTGSVLNITTLAITSANQGRSYGGEGLRWIEQFGISESCREIVLETANARRFYEKHGYRLIGERDERGYPLYIMWKAFKLFRKGN